MGAFYSLKTENTHIKNRLALTDMINIVLLVYMMHKHILMKKITWLVPLLFVLTDIIALKLSNLGLHSGEIVLRGFRNFSTTIAMIGSKIDRNPAF